MKKTNENKQTKDCGSKNCGSNKTGGTKNCGKNSKNCK